MIKAWRKLYKIIADKNDKEKKFRVSWFVILENVHRNDKSVSVQDVKSVVNKTLMRPGRFLGYRGMHLKLKTFFH